MSTRRIHATFVAAALVPLLATAGGSELEAQDNIIDKGTSGVRESARFADRTPIDYDTAARARTLRLRATPPPPRPAFRLLFTPSAVATEGVNVYGATLGFINQSLITTVPFQVRTGYRRLDVEGGDGLDRFNVNAKVRLDPISRIFSEATTLTLIGDFTRTVDVSKRWEATLAGEQALTPKLAFGLNGSYVERDADEGGSDNAWIASTGVVYTITDRTDFSVDYQFDNRLDGEDDHSFTVTQLLSDPTEPRRLSLVFGAGKHRVVFATFVLVF